ncbi:MAG: hypothetical protein HYX32_01140 [Actinobacteria bacterium]|nr:hypothetical protein [Actinomycetota bacterium]
MITVATSVVLALAALGCSRAPDTAQQGSASAPSPAGPKPGGSLVYGIGDESTGWMPATDRWGPGPINVARALFDPLVVVGDDGQLHPWLAESFTPQDGNKTWLITVRKNIKFHNGEPVDGNAVVYNLQAFRTSALSAFAFKPVTNIEKLDDYTAKVTLDQPWGNFPALFTGQAGFIVAPEQLRTNNNEKPIGSGPFMFQSWKRDSELVVAKNPDYWRTDPQGRKLPFLDQVKFRPTPDESSRAASLAAGDIDVYHTSSSKGVARLVKGNLPENTKALFDESQGDELMVVLNTQTGPATDLRLRKAMQYATDRDALVAQYDDAYEAADGPFSTKSQWWSDSGQPKVDLDKAKELVAEYQKDNPGPVRITVAVTASTDGLEAGQLLQSQWAAAGIQADIQSQEVTKFSQSLVGGGFQAILFPFMNGEDPDVNYHFWTGTNIGTEGSISLNFPRWSNAEVDQALNAGRAETDPAKRKADYAIVWKAWAENAPYIFLYHTTWAIVYRDNVYGLDEVNLPDGQGKQQKISWGTVNLSNTWTDKT